MPPVPELPPSQAARLEASLKALQSMFEVLDRYRAVETARADGGRSPSQA